MAAGTLTNTTIANTYKSLLKVKGGANQLLDGTPRLLEDGDGNDSVLAISTDSVLISGSGTRLDFSTDGSGEYISGDGTDLTITSGNDIILSATSNVGIGTTSPDTLLEISKDSADSELTLSTYHDTDATTSKLTLRKSNGSEASPTKVNEPDVLGTISFQGYNDQSSTFEEGSRISSIISATPSNTSGDMQGTIHFWTAPSASATVEKRMSIMHNGKVGIGTAIPSELLNISSSTTLKPVLLITNTTDDANSASLDFYNNRATPTDGDVAGRINFYAKNGASSKTLVTELKIFKLFCISLAYFCRSVCLSACQTLKSPSRFCVYSCTSIFTSAWYCCNSAEYFCNFLASSASSN